MMQAKTMAATFTFEGIFPLSDADQTVLAALAFTAFQEGNFRHALALIDRACRIASPIAEYLCLRALIREKLGDDKECLQDFVDAARLRPFSEEERWHVMKTAFRYGDYDKCFEIAETFLTGSESSHRTHKLLLELLAQISPSGIGWQVSRHDGGALSLRWNGVGRCVVEMVLQSADGRTEDDHPKIVEITSQGRDAVFDHAADVVYGWSEKAARISISAPFPLLGEPLARPLMEKRFHDQDDIINLTALQAGMATAGTCHVTVIIPVYRDLEATRACVESVLEHTPIGDGVSLVIVDDASPEPALSDYVRGLAADERITCIVRARNGGFIAAVESALSLIPEGDIVLLNADTLVPSGWLDTLVRVAGSDERIGTVTPLSNNGELTSFPVAFTANPMPDDLSLISETARRVNGDEAIDIPNGIGFCLYIKRVCFDSVGHFGSAFLKSGYFEDVDFSLRVAKKGFRNVCATGVLIAHRGSASYLDTKRGLVLKNMGEITRRFPELPPITDQFMAQDPLKPARRRIVEALFGSVIKADVAVLVSGGRDGDYDALARRCLRDSGKVCLIVHARTVGEPARISINSPWPCHFEVELRAPEAINELAALLRAAGVSLLLHLLHDRPDPFFLRLADALSALPFEIAVLEGAALLNSDTDMVARMHRAVKVHPGSSGCSARLMQWWPDIPLEAALAAPFPRQSMNRSKTDFPFGDLAVIVLDRGPQAWRDIRELAIALYRHGDNRTIFVFGRTVNDTALMRIGNVIVLGDVAPEEWASQIGAYHCAMAIIVCRKEIFYDPRLSLLAALPVPLSAYELGAVGELLQPDVDLAIDPGLSSLDAADVVIRQLRYRQSAPLFQSEMAGSNDD